MTDYVIREDPVFGTLTLERGRDWYVALATWNGTAVQLKISVEGDHDFAAALESAHRLWRDQPAWDARVLDCAAAKLLPLKNSDWLDEDESEVSADQFRRRMTLKSIWVSADGSFDFWYDDGDLFWGHTIDVSGSLEDGPSDAQILG